MLFLNPVHCSGILLGVLLLGCSEAPSEDAARAAASAAQLQADTSLFSAAVQAMRSEVLYPLRVDPRPMRAGADPSQPLQRDQLADIGAAVVAARTGILLRLGVAQANTIEDSECAFVRAYPPPPGVGLSGPADLAPRRCREVPNFSSVMFSLPRHGCDRYPAAGECWTIRAMEVTPNSFLVFDLLARPEQDGSGWRIEVENVGGAMS